MTDLKGAVTMITGGRTGVGKALAFEAARRGSSILIASLDDATATTKELREAGAIAEWAQTDVRDIDSWAHLRAFALEKFGHVNVLINNAAGGRGDGSLEAAPLEELSQVMATNIFGYIYGIRTFAEDLRKASSAGMPAYVLNVGSEHSLGVPPHVMPLSPYTVSKQAELAITEVTRRDLAGTGVGVSLVAPGWVLTELVTDLADSSPEFAASVRPFAQSSDVVARITLDGMLAGRDVIVTNPKSVPFARERAEKLLADYAWAEQREREYAEFE